MRSDVKQAVGRPDNTYFIRNCLIYGAILALMLLAAPAIFDKIMVPMAADGIKVAWNCVFVPLAAAMMVFSLFRSWRRRWPRAYMNSYNAEVKAGGYETCPRCGSAVVMKKRTRFHRVKTGELVTTTTYSDGSQKVDREDIYGSEARTEYYYVCSNNLCAIEADRSYGESHLPWKTKQIRCLVLNDSSLLGRGKQSAANLLLSRLLVIFLAIVIVAVCGITVYNYADLLDGDWVGITADGEPDRTAGAYREHLLSQDDQHNWFVSYEKAPTDMMSYLEDCFGRDKAIGYSIGGNVTDDGVVLTFRFEGEDAGTGITRGEFTLMNLDGEMVLIDDANELIYKQDTEFYQTYTPTLLELTHDKALSEIFSRVEDGEHAIYDSAVPVEYLRKDNTTVFAYMNKQDPSQIGNEFRAVTTYPEEQMKEMWICSYDDYEYVPDSLEGYVYSDAMPLYDESSELGKLIKKSSDGDGDYDLYRNDELILSIDIATLANGFEFEIDDVAECVDKGFEE